MLIWLLYVIPRVAPMIEWSYYWRSLALPGSLVIVLLMFTQKNSTPVVRFSATGGVLVLFLVVTRLQPGWYLRTELLAIVFFWAAGQCLLGIAGFVAQRGTASHFVNVLQERGYIGTAIAGLRGEFGDSIAAALDLSRWAALIFLSVLLLWNAETLSTFEAIFLPPPKIPANEPRNAVLVGVTTPDNNAVRYLTTALQLCRKFREAGAVISVFPRIGRLDSTTAPLVNAIRREGGMTFAPRIDQSPPYFSMRFNPAYMVYQPVVGRWYDARTAPEPCIQAAARYLKAPDVSLASAPRNTELRLGRLRIPIWSDGQSAVINYNFAFEDGWKKEIWWPGALIKDNWDSSLTYMEFSTGKRSQTVPDSAWQQLSGKMVFVHWTNAGDDYRPNEALGQAMIAEMLVRGYAVTQPHPWHIAVTCVLLAFAVFLGMRVKPWLLCVSMTALAVLCVLAGSWMFHAHLVLAEMIYPASAALLSAIVLPLVQSARRKDI